jgi:hypothetical protein
MATLPGPKPEQTKVNTQDLPEIPTVPQMEAWDTEEVLRWIKQRGSNILKGDNLEKFNKAGIIGRAFLASDVDFYESCGLPRGIGLALKDLADEVKGEFIPRT